MVLDTLLVRDTTFVDNVVLDTFVVRDTTVLVTPSAPIIETVYRDGSPPTRTRPKLLPSITVEPGGWRQPVELVQAVCKSVQKTLSEPLIYALDSDIVVRHVEPEGPKVLYSRTPTGSYVIWLDTENTNVEQNVFQFAHEYGHLMSNYYQVRSGPNKWFDESLSSMASLYVLRKIHEKILAGAVLNVYVPSQNTTWYLHSMMNRLLPYAEQNIPGQRMDAAQFRAWFEARLPGLSENPYLRRSNDMIAHNLIDIFETNPEAWNAVRYLNIQGPVSWNQNQDFGTYLHGWYLRTPSMWQKYVAEIAGRFGYYPASKPALTGTDGMR